MKKIHLIILIGLLVSINSYGQQQVTIQDIVTLNLTKNTKKLKKDELAALESEDGKTSPIVYEQFKGESYKAEGFLVQLNAASVAARPDFLEQQKREMDDLFSLAQPQVYNTLIKRFQNYAAVITHYEYSTEGKGYFIFKSYNNTGDSVLVGTIEYGKGNKEVAEEALNEILNSIKFKN